MSKKVLILSSSPRKNGNSEILCSAFAAGAQAAGHAVETVRIEDKEIHPCTGCYACRGNGKCAQKDDMAPVLDAILAADVLVLSTPVYFYSMSAQLKTVIDRTVARYTSIRNKEFYFILTAADESKSLMKPTIEGLRGFTSCLPGAQEKGIVYGLGAWEKGAIRKTPAVAEARALGENV